MLSASAISGEAMAANDSVTVPAQRQNQPARLITSSSTILTRGHDRAGGLTVD